MGRKQKFYRDGERDEGVDYKAANKQMASIWWPEKRHGRRRPISSSRRDFFFFFFIIKTKH